MARDLFIFQNEKSSARVLVVRDHPLHTMVDVWVSQMDLFQADPHADEWVQREIKPIAHVSGVSLTLQQHGPGFRLPTFIIPASHFVDGDNQKQN